MRHFLLIVVFLSFLALIAFLAPLVLVGGVIVEVVNVVLRVAGL